MTETFREQTGRGGDRVHSIGKRNRASNAHRLFLARREHAGPLFLTAVNHIFIFSMKGDKHV
ncbi:hypothetical protein ACH95_01080 [Bacillus glycinifermentans]|uniref:Uncharacterized protein n=1 Tax=Bacillus glycinifermentans TaxID=1664069 RepID=A0A0J6HWU7_9BACI|nr:hypothetical protein COP00_12800 [Bacillus glycinifermentans]KMM63447.1 hypothetical protein ACH95_01080 [Bacillus glycinifermentans]KRT90456.1 hypothetical protein AB447_207710 [Bacillus glycinifermentans]